MADVAELDLVELLAKVNSPHTAGAVSSRQDKTEEEDRDDEPEADEQAATTPWKILSKPVISGKVCHCDIRRGINHGMLSGQLLAGDFLVTQSAEANRQDSSGPLAALMMLCQLDLPGSQLQTSPGNAD
jgi:hypothetical protein